MTGGVEKEEEEDSFESLNNNKKMFDYVSLSKLCNH